MKDKKILVTGANGFLGSYIVRHLLNEGYLHILAGCRAGSNLEMLSGLEDHVELTELDILDVCRLEELINEVDAVIHTAATVSFEPRLRETMYKVNVEGTANLVNVCLGKPIIKFVHISSVAALGRLKNHLTIDEQTKWSNSPFNTHYAISKYMAEQEVWRAFHEGLPAAVINPSLILGAGNWTKGSVNIVDSIYKGISFFPVGSTGIVDVRDVAKMTGLLLESPIYGERFICNGGNISYRDLFSKIAVNLKIQPPTKPLTPWLEALAWRVEAFKNRLIKKPLTVTRETLMTSSMSFAYNASKAKSMFNFEFRDPDSILQDCCNAFLKTKEEYKNFGVYK
ncbi:MAG TPA: SDR family oxidoreductase [Saprospiraceae bacterium]|nr:SDR family oxidoreductase [Saprospiraceae bacterium]